MFWFPSLPGCMVQELAQLYNDYKDKGLVILGFPCNQVSGCSLHYPDQHCRMLGCFACI